MVEEIDRYAWFEETGLAKAVCLTIVKGSDLRQAAWAFGGDLDDAVPMPLAQVYDPDIETTPAALRRVGEWIVVIEDAGWQGSRAEVLRRLSGEAVSAYRNVEAVTAFSVASGGSVLTTFEVLAPHHRSGADPGAIDEHLAGLPWESREVGLMQLMLALTERVTGFMLRREHLDGEFSVVPLLPWQKDVPTAINPVWATSQDQRLWEAMQRADDDARRRAAWVAVRHAARACALLDHPILAPVLAGQPTQAQSAALDAYAREVEPQQRWPLFRTVEAARAALSPHSTVAVWEAVTSAGYALGASNQPTAPMRTAVLAALGA